MKLSYNVTGQERKSLVGEVSAVLNQPTHYNGAPTFSYQVGEYTIDKVGTLTGPDNLDLEDALHQAGFDADSGSREYDEPDTYESGLGGMGALPSPEELMAELPASDAAPGTIAIELPVTNVKPEILKAMLNSKATLITAALGEDGVGGLPIEFDESEGKVRFEWLRSGADSDTVKAWSAFLAAAAKFSKTAKRVTAKDTAARNEKFAFRTFMVKIGMNDADNKAWRRLLLKNLKGDSAFATPESKERWLLKHGTKKNTEVAVNE
jgi:hypothetical protein